MAFLRLKEEQDGRVDDEEEDDDGDDDGGTWSKCGVCAARGSIHFRLEAIKLRSFLQLDPLADIS